MAKLMLSVMGATLAKQRGAYRGRKRAISDKDLQKLKLKDRVASGEKKAQVAAVSVSVGKTCINICVSAVNACRVPGRRAKKPIWPLFR